MKEPSYCLGSHFWPQLKPALPLSSRYFIGWTRLANQGEGGPLPYQAAAQECWTRLVRAHADAAGMRHSHPGVLPPSVRLPAIASRLEDGRLISVGDDSKAVVWTSKL